MGYYTTFDWYYKEMKITVEPGVYVVAVSGGVDSMVLLDLLRRLPGVKLVVAHYDHGIRPDAAADRRLVQQAAQAHGLPFVYDEGGLGAAASELAARRARYDFLHTVRLAARARAIITAHHQDDMLETAIINVIRGTGRRGLSSLRSRDRLVRPLLGYSKQDIRAYARAHRLEWREDSTNQDEKYLRNYVRRKILNKLSVKQQAQLLAHIDTAKQLNDQIDQLLQVQLHLQPAGHTLDRQWFISLPHALAREVMAGWLRTRGAPFDSKSLHRLVVAAKTYPPGKQTDVSKQTVLKVTKRYLALVPADR